MQHPRSWLQRLLALAVAVLFITSVGVSPAEAAKGFSSSSKSFSSGSRSFSSGSKSSSSTKPSTSKPSSGSSSSGSKSFSSPKPSTGSSNSGGGFSSSSKTYSSESRSFSSKLNPFSKSTPAAPPKYDLGRTTYPSRPPVVIIGSSPYDDYYWHNYYWGRPWYWRAWHSPTYNNGYWSVSWVPFVLGAIGLWILIAVIVSRRQRRRRF